ncbi:hypothetical protein [Pelomonas sp. V22]|uniref:hypothetical protein n=1 Tax=Pelomonas sp. V22 TaxID=2822139 RepID=UPI0024A9B489|nr:hypothetical protein [Pelomonas sp. V22]
MNGPQILVPLEITDTSLYSSTIAEPDTTIGEAAWISGHTYAIGDEAIRVETHRVYRRESAGAGTIPPEDDTANWTDIRPTNKWAAFDGEISTQSRDTEALTYVLRPGFFNSVSVYGADGEKVRAIVKDAPGGSVIFDQEVDLIEPVPDWYEWYFSPIRAATKAVFSEILPYPDAELTISVTSSPGVAVKFGLIAVGDLRGLISGGGWGGTLGGAKAEPRSFSYIKTEIDGTTRIVKRRAATDTSFSVAMPREIADYALVCVQEVLDVPCAVIASSGPGFQGLNNFGLVSGSMSYDSFGTATLTLNVKGLV